VPPGDESPGAGGFRFGTLLCLALVAVLAVTSLLFYLSGLYVRGVNGRIGMVENPAAPRESWRVVPAADVEVLVTWDAQPLDTFMYGRSRCVRAALTRTDAKGEFKVDGSWLPMTWPPLSSSFAASHAIKPGYYSGWDYPEVARPDGYTSVLGPALVNPWTGLTLKDEDAGDLLRNGDCPDIE